MATHRYGTSLQHGPRDTAPQKQLTLGPTVACKALGCDRIQNFEALLVPNNSLLINPWPSWPSRTLLQRQDIHCNCSRWFPSGWQCPRRMRGCAWRCLMSSNALSLVSSKFLLDANATNVPATETHGVLAKRSSRSPHKTCCAAKPGFHSLSTCLAATWNAAS